MRRTSPRSLIAALVVFPALLGGCLGDAGEPPLPPVMDDVDEPAPSAVDGPVLVDDDAVHGLKPWLRTTKEARFLPDPLRLVQVAYERTDAGALRWLWDGTAFVLIVDDSLAPYPDGTMVLARVLDTSSGFDVARGAWTLGDTGGLQADGRVPVAVVADEPVRYGNAFAYEVLVFTPEDAATAPYAVVADEIGPNDLPQATLTPQNVTGDTWNATVHEAWAGPFSFRADWALAFDGPAEGSDAPDPVERPLLGGAETGTYTLRVDGSRIWFADVSLDFALSRVAGSDPHAGGNGSTTLRFEIDGYQPVTNYLEMLPDRGLDQRFKMDVLVDFETEADLQQPGQQIFSFGATITYRFGSETYSAGTDGRTLQVSVTGATP